MKVFAVIDHSGEAAKAGLAMPPTKLVIFGNPRAGTPLMLAAPSIAIDLPLKVLVAQDTAGNVSVSYNSPAYLQQRRAPRGPAPDHRGRAGPRREGGRIAQTFSLLEGPLNMMANRMWVSGVWAILAVPGALAAQAQPAAPAHVAVPVIAVRPEDVNSIEAIVKADYECISGGVGVARQWSRDLTLYDPNARFFEA